MSDPKVIQTRGVFSMMCRVEVNILATPDRIWRLLTDATDFPRWNSTVAAIEGQIREGEKLRLRVPGSDRVLTPNVSDVVPNQHMMWRDGFAPVFKGVRTFDLHPGANGSTDFVMRERFSGLLLPVIKGSLPEFGPIFARYASDLKRESEQPSTERR
jgi:uncharacterized protein YndB with AHSA1/START domain